MGKRTPLYEKHQKAQAKLIDFGGWEMPLHYGSQLQEHLRVRRDAGVFDVSHMTIIDLSGSRAQAFLRFLLANNIDRLTVRGKALYTCMLNERGGIIDDLIVYFCDTGHYRLVVNAATRDKDLAWLEQQAAPFAVTLQERRDLAMLAVQGPQARSKILPLLPESLREQTALLKPFHACWREDWLISRTGYTGEDGLEIMLPAETAEQFWDNLLQAGISPAGLGARDTLRLEAGLCLYGQDMDETNTPCESGLGWTVAWLPEERDFIGRAAIEPFRVAGPERILVGLILQAKGVLRPHQTVHIEGVGNGEMTSGTFSPTLGIAIGLARIPSHLVDEVKVQIRDQLLPARVVKLPFVRHGKACVEI